MTPDESFAREVVSELERHGYQALWAGGCVRDRLLDKPPKDYDVATNATPQQVREVFGRQRTLFIGAAFGVVSVLGRKGMQPVEVATFRKDGGYTDGRHPDSVVFSDAKEDALRRDFTINGLFYHPFEDRVIDYVGGEADLSAGLIRCIGDPNERFGEDKLRMLRAVRFATTLGFAVADSTMAAIAERPAELEQVSAERIAAEMTRLMTNGNSARGLELLDESGLRPIVLPEFGQSDATCGPEWSQFRRLHERLSEPRCFPTAIATLGLALRDHASPESLMTTLALRWKLANQDRDCAIWLLDKLPAVREARNVPWPDLQPILIHTEVKRLLRFCRDVYGVDDPDAVDHLDFCNAQLQRPPRNSTPIH